MAKILRDIAEILIITALVFLLMQVAFPRHFVQGVSMQPTFYTGDRLLRVPEFVEWAQFWRADAYELGDIVIFEPPPAYFDSPVAVGGADDFVKRVVGAPGDEVVIQNGRVFVNSVEYNIPGEVATGQTFIPSNGAIEYPFIVPPDSYFVLGDNRDASSDSRFWGAVAADNIIGRIWFVYWPLSNWRLL